MIKRMTGPRLYDFAAAKLGALTEKDHQRWLLVRRHIETGELAYYLCCAPLDVTARDLARASGRRWGIEVAFECGGGQALTGQAADRTGRVRGAQLERLAKTQSPRTNNPLVRLAKKTPGHRATISISQT